MDANIIIALIAAVPGILMGGLSLWSSRKKVNADTNKTNADAHKTNAETNLIYTQVADRWAEHVEELSKKINLLETSRDADRAEISGLRIDIAQVRRENEIYRRELAERDLIIADLKDWAERLIRQLAQHAPSVKPEDYYRKILGDQ